jgi:hypothetical protein
MSHGKRRAGQFLAEILAVTALFGCNQDGNGGTTQSGIVGRVVLAGTCPETWDSFAGTTCADRPEAARIAVRSPQTHAVLAHVLTAADGTFRIALEPGSYELQPMNLTGAPLPSAEIVTVTVEQGHLSDVRVVFDAGVRNGSK